MLINWLSTEKIYFFLEKCNSHFESLWCLLLWRLTANDAASSWWLDLTHKSAKWHHHNRREPFETTPYSSHLKPIHSSHLTLSPRWCPRPVQHHPPSDPVPPPAPHGSPHLIYPPLNPPLSYSFTPKRSAHSGSQWAPSTFSVSLSRRGLSHTQAPSKIHAQSVVIRCTPVGSPFYAWCATNGATAAALGFTPQLTTGGWPHGAVPHTPLQSHLQAATPTREP